LNLFDPGETVPTDTLSFLFWGSPGGGKSERQISFFSYNCIGFRSAFKLRGCKGCPLLVSVVLEVGGHDLELGVNKGIEGVSHRPYTEPLIGPELNDK
jgi:hypothetical protein